MDYGSTQITQYALNVARVLRMLKLDTTRKKKKRKKNCPDKEDLTPVSADLVNPRKGGQHNLSSFSLIMVAATELKSCVKVKVALTDLLVRTVSGDEKQH